MSIATEVKRLQDAKKDLKAAINAKGGQLDAERLDEYAKALDALLPKNYGFRVRFIDFDGTVLKELYVADGAKVEPPEPMPTHEGMKFQEWNVPLDNIHSHRDIGAIYTTESGASEFDITLIEAVGSTVTFNILAKNGTITVDWGDDTAAESESVENNKSLAKSHTYSTYGTYTVKISASDGGTWEIPQNFCKDNSTSGENYCLIAARITGITKINANAFQKCYGLRRIALSTDVTTLGNYAFNECHALTAAVLPKQITTLPEYLFQSCYALSKIVFAPNAIPKYVCNKCYSLDAVTLPDNVYNIHDYAFSDCNALRVVHFPSTVSTIQQYAFQKCHALRRAELSEKVTTIGDTAFSGCTALESVHLPETLTSLTDDAFNGCESLKSVKIPAKVTTIPDSCFSECSSLETVEFHEGLTTIKQDAFYYCYCLRELTLPASLKTIGSDAFNSCTALQRIRCLNEEPPTISSDTFYNLPKTCVIYVPKSEGMSVLTKYKTASNWSSLASQMAEWEDAEP